jgi:hypothetical protein
MAGSVVDSRTIGTLTVDKLDTGAIRFTRAGERIELWGNVSERENLFQMIKLA